MEKFILHPQKENLVILKRFPAGYAPNTEDVSYAFGHVAVICSAGERVSGVRGIDHFGPPFPSLPLEVRGLRSRPLKPS